MILKSKIYNRNEARWTTVNAGIKTWFRAPHSFRCVVPPNDSMCLAMGGEPVLNASAQVDKTEHDDGSWDLGIRVKASYFYKGCEILLWDMEFFTDGETLDDCYRILREQLYECRADMRRQQRKVDSTLKTLAYGGLLV